MRFVLRVFAAVAAMLLLISVPVYADEPVILFDSEDGATANDLLAEEPTVWPTAAAPTVPLSVPGKAAVLMDYQSGTVLYEHDADKPLPIASVTKIMTLLLVAEAVDDGLITTDDVLTCSANAASMGGSQIWLEVGEQMAVHELLKAAAVVSANDACVMLAEYLCGTVEGFVSRMNTRAAELGCRNTQFLDCSGLDDKGYSSARDVALMARELLRHEWVTGYTSLWMDSLRGGKSQLVNTNKLVRHYEGATGLKTGTTNAAGHCLCATATRGDLSLIAVTLGCATTDDRFNGARAMLDYGFAMYSVCTPQVETPAPIPVRHGQARAVTVAVDGFDPLLVPKGKAERVTAAVTVCDDLEAPVLKGQTVGTVTFSLEGEELLTVPVRAAEEVARMTFAHALYRLLCALIG